MRAPFFLQPFLCVYQVAGRFREQRQSTYAIAPRTSVADHLRVVSSATSAASPQDVTISLYASVFDPAPHVCTPTLVLPIIDVRAAEALERKNR